MRQNKSPVHLANGPATGIGFGTLIIGFLIYDMLWKSPLAKNEKVGTAVSFVLLVVATFGMSQVMNGRAVFIHVGALMGTIMAANVWMRIWPSQRKIIAGIKGTGPAADPSVAALAGLRSKHNTYMSIPLLFFMISFHYPALPIGGFDFSYGNREFGWAVASIMVLLGWGIARYLYGKSASEAPNSF